jgi:hypothetical protein
MVYWAGIDEAGYGPLLGPLVVAGTVFELDHRPGEGMLWEALSDAVTRTFGGADGRLVVNDSKEVYSPSRGIRALEEGVLSFLALLEKRPRRVGEFLSAVLPPRIPPTDGTPWTADVEEMDLPLETNASAVESKAAVLEEALRSKQVSFAGARAVVVLPEEYNEIVARTRNKSRLLWQKCGLLIQRLWRRSEGTDSYVLVDRHGGRSHYHKLLRDAFPACEIMVQREEKEASVYRLSDRRRTMWLAFKKGGDRRAMPAALGSMLAKYTREVYMRAFNAYWATRMEGLKPTAGYAQDAHRFLDDIADLIREYALDERTLIRGR